MNLQIPFSVLILSSVYRPREWKAVHPKEARPHRVRLKRPMSVFTDRDQFVESATKGSQIKFLIRSGDNPVHIIVTQTLCIVRHTGEVIELYIFRFLEILVKGYGTRRRSHPQTAVIVGSDKTSLVAGINRITFQMVTVIDKQNLSVLILREIIDTTGKGSRPDSPVMILRTHNTHCYRSSYTYHPLGEDNGSGLYDIPEGEVASARISPSPFVAIQITPFES